MDDYLFMLVAVLLCMMIFLAMIASLYMEVKLMRTELNDYIFYTYKRPAEYVVENGGDEDAVSVPSA